MGSDFLGDAPAEPGRSGTYTFPSCASWSLEILARDGTVRWEVPMQDIDLWHAGQVFDDRLPVLPVVEFVRYCACGCGLRVKGWDVHSSKIYVDAGHGSKAAYDRYRREGRPSEIRFCACGCGGKVTGWKAQPTKIYVDSLHAKATRRRRASRGPRKTPERLL